MCLYRFEFVAFDFASPNSIILVLERVIEISKMRSKPFNWARFEAIVVAMRIEREIRAIATSKYGIIFCVYCWKSRFRLCNDGFVCGLLCGWIYVVLLYRWIDFGTSTLFCTWTTSLQVLMVVSMINGTPVYKSACTPVYRLVCTPVYRLDCTPVCGWVSWWDDWWYF